MSSVLAKAVSSSLAGFVASCRRQSPVFTVGLAASFGLGLWVAAATFAYTRYYAFREPPGIHDSQLLRRVYLTRAGESPYALAPVLSLQELQQLQLQRGSWQIEGYALRTAQVKAAGSSRAMTTAVSTAGLLHLLGVKPRVGALLSEAPPHESAMHGAVISDRLWHEAFASSPRALGAPIRIDGRLLTVVGILPPGFTGIDRQPTDVWLLVDPTERSPPASASTTYFLSAVVKLSAVTDERSVPHRILHALEESSSRTPVASVVLRPLSSNRFGDDGVRRIAPYALMFALAVLLLALCNCFLLLAGRVYESLPQLRIRSALGAPAARLWISIAAAPAIVMTATAFLTLATLPWSSVVLRLMGFEQPFDLLDATSRLGIALVACACIAVVHWALVFLYRSELNAPGIAPTRRTPAGHRFRDLLGLCYLTVTSGLAVAIVPVAHAYSKVVSVDPGFDARFAFVVRADIEPAHHGDRGSRAIAHVLDELAKVPGVRSVAASTSFPFEITITSPLALDAANDRVIPVHLYYVLGDILGALGLPSSAGDPKNFESPGSRYVVVNEALAGMWPNSPLGKCLPLNGHPCYVVSGIARNSNVVALGEEPRPVLYVGMAERPITSTVYFVVRTRGDVRPAGVASLQSVVRRGLTGASLRTTALAELVQRQSAPARRLVQAGILLLAIACVLAFFGLRATVLLHVETRKHDMGILMALGASRLRVFFACCQDLVWVSAVSIIGGYGLGMLLVRVLSMRVSNLLFAGAPEELAAALVLPLALAVGAALPAWHTARLEPARLLTAKVL